MAIASKTILDTIEWAKKLNFNRSSVIGNFLEPALTSANMVMQTILGPPFEWWWNNQDVVFNATNVPPSASITAWAIAGNVLTLTVANNFTAGQIFDLSAFVTSTFFNGTSIVLTTANSTTVTAFYQHANSSGTEAGTMTSTTVQDYTVPVSGFGHMQFASVKDVSANKWMQMEVKDNLALSVDVGRPRFIGANTEDANGNITFRVQPAPDKVYPVNVQIAKIPVPVTSINQTWAPIPDFMGYIYNWGFLALMYMFADDPRFAMANQKFIAHLLGAAEGLTEQEKDIFLNNWSDLTRMQNQTNTQGINARAT